MPNNRAFETEMRVNRVALSPLLIKKQGVLRVRVEEWCAEVCKTVEETRKALQLEIPSLLVHDSLPFELLKSQADKLMSLGLSNGRNSSAADWLSDDIRDLMSSIDKALTKREARAVAGFVEHRACLVSEDEPSPRSSRLQNIIEQRHQEAKSRAKRSQRNVEDEAKRLLDELAGDTLAYSTRRIELSHQVAPHGRIPAFRRPPERYENRLAAWPSKGATVPLPHPIELLIDETILLLRHELLKDITSAAEDPLLSTWGASRARSVADQAKELACRLNDAAQDEADHFRKTYADAAFSPGRNSMMINRLPV